jgi:hypothetical protein
MSESESYSWLYTETRSMYLPYVYGNTKKYNGAERYS